MKRYVIAAFLLLGLTINAMGADKRVQIPGHVLLADLLIQSYAGQDGKLDKTETVGALKFLHNNLPEKTGHTNMSVMLSRLNNINNTPRGDMTAERNAIREFEPEHYVDEFMAKYDSDRDKVLNRRELINAMVTVIGMPQSSGKVPKKAFANR